LRAEAKARHLTLFKSDIIQSNPEAKKRLLFVRSKAEFTGICRIDRITARAKSVTWC